MSRRQRLLELICSRRTPEEHAVCSAAFHAILGGAPADRGELLSATGLDPETVGAVLDRLIRRGLVVVDQGSGRVVGSWGLSSAPTEHRLRIRGRELYTWCAVDAVGVPAGLGEDATVTSHCSHCGAPVSITMIAGQVGRAEPAECTSGWLLLNRRARWWATRDRSSTSSARSSI